MKHIQELQDFLNKSSFANELNHLNKILKFADNEELMKWQKLLEEIEAPIPPQVFGSTLNLISENAKAMGRFGSELAGTGKEEIQSLFQTLHQHPEVKAVLSRDKLIKEAQIMNLLKNFGGKALKLIPLMSFFIALKNFLYGIRAFVYLTGYEQNLGLEWYDIFVPQKMANFIDQNQNNPEKLAIISKMIKSMKVFIDEVVSMVANSVDGVKDLVFLVLEMATSGVAAATGGLTAWIPTGLFAIDISFSIVMMIIDNIVDSRQKGDYNELLERLEEIARRHIARLTSTLPEADSTDFSKLSPEEILRELEKIDLLS